MKNYTVTIGYKAVLSVSVKADSHEEAQKKAGLIFQKERYKPYKSKDISLQDDSCTIAGSVNDDESWNTLNY